jgi:hypothetical protein
VSRFTDEMSYLKWQSPSKYFHELLETIGPRPNEMRNFSSRI